MGAEAFKNASASLAATIENETVNLTVTLNDPVAALEPVTTELLQLLNRDDLLSATVNGETIDLSQTDAATLLWGLTPESTTLSDLLWAGPFAISLRCKTSENYHYSVDTVVTFQYSDALIAAQDYTFQYMRGIAGVIPGYLNQEATCAAADRPIWFSVDREEQGQNRMVCHFRDAFMETGTLMAFAGSGTGLTSALVNNPQVQALAVISVNGVMGNKVAMKKPNGDPLGIGDRLAAASKLGTELLKPMGLTTTSTFQETLAAEHNQVTIVLFCKAPDGTLYQDHCAFTFVAGPEPDVNAASAWLSAADKAFGHTENPYPYTAPPAPPKDTVSTATFKGGSDAASLVALQAKEAWTGTYMLSVPKQSTDYYIEVTPDSTAVGASFVVQSSDGNTIYYDSQTATEPLCVLTVEQLGGQPALIVTAEDRITKTVYLIMMGS